MINSTPRFLIRTAKKTFVINFEEVVCCIADDNYTNIHLADGSHVMASKTLKKFETMLCTSNFIRIHASSLINLNYVKRIVKSKRLTVELNHDIRLDVSRARHNRMKQMLSSL